MDEIVRQNNIEVIHGQVAVVAGMTIFQNHTNNKYAGHDTCSWFVCMEIMNQPSCNST